MAFIAAAAPALTLIGGGLTAASTVAGGIATSNAKNYQAAVARNNQVVATQNAEHAALAGEAQAAATSMKGAAKNARLKVGQAASGIDVNSGSAVDVQEGEALANKLDAETVMSNAELQVYGYRTQANNYGAQAELDQSAADNAIPAAALSATGSLLSSASGIGTKWSGGGGSNPVPDLPFYAPDDI